MSENAKHTPGPWHWDFRDPDYTVWSGESLADTDGEHIASVYGDGTIEQAIGNCTLIATAPELLASLKASIDVILLMQEWARQVSDQYLDGDPQFRFDYAADIQSANEAVRLYRAFIAKAEGQ